MSVASSLVWIIAAVYFAFLICRLVCYIASLQIVGSANEFIVVFNNGEQKEAGVGLRLFKGPFDTVAKFPSKVNKINFETREITKEMQGVRCCAMIVWSIYREGDGPMRAYRSLGSDLESQEPRTANEILVKMAEAILRNRIANSSIDQVVKNRQVLREAILDEMKDICKGWGVWLETVEITDVQIMSQTLFHDMQTQFVEINNKNATLQKMEADFQIKSEQQRQDLIQLKRTLEYERDQKFLNWKQEVIKQRLELQSYEKNIQVQKKQITRENEQNVFDQIQTNEKEVNNQKVHFQQTKNTVARDTEKELAQRNVIKSRFNRDMIKTKNEVDLKEQSDNNERSKKQNKYDMVRQIMQDPSQKKLLLLQTIKELYQSMQFQEFQFQQMAGKDPVADVIGRFTKMVTA